MKNIKTKPQNAYTLVEVVAVVAVVLVLSGVAVAALGLNRCASLEASCRREVQVLNSAYQSYIAAGGTPLATTATTDEVYAAIRQPVNGVGPFLVREGPRPVFMLCTGVDGPEWGEKGFTVPTPTPVPTATPTPAPASTPTPTPGPTASPTPVLPLTVAINTTDTDQGDPITITADITNPNPDATEAELRVEIPGSFEPVALLDGWTYDAAGPSVVYRGSIPSGDFTSPGVTLRPLSPAGAYTVTATLDGNFEQANVSAPVVVSEAFSAISVDTTASPQSVPYGGSGVLNVTITNPNPSSYVTLDIALPSGPIAITHQGQWLSYAGESAPASDVATNATYVGPASYLFSGTLSLPSGWSLVQTGSAPGMAIVAGFDENGQLVGSYEVRPTAQMSPIYNLRFEGPLPQDGTTSVALPFTGSAIGSHSVTASNTYAGVTCPDGTQTIVPVSTTSAVVNVQAPATPTPTPSPTPPFSPIVVSSSLIPMANADPNYYSIGVTITNPNPTSTVVIDVPLPAGVTIREQDMFADNGEGWSLTSSLLRFSGTIPSNGSTFMPFAFEASAPGSYSFGTSNTQVNATLANGTQTVVPVTSTPGVLTIQPPATPTPTPAPTPTPTPSIVSSVASPVQPNRNVSFTYTVTLRNNGASSLTGNFTASFPVYTTLSAVSGTGWSRVNRQLKYTGSLASGATTTGTITLVSGMSTTFTPAVSGASGALSSITVRP